MPLWTWEGTEASRRLNLAADHGNPFTELRPWADEIPPSLLRSRRLCAQRMTAPLAQRSMAVTIATNGPNPRNPKVQRAHHHPLRMY